MALRMLALFVMLSFSLYSGEIVGRVVRITDGDTITILDAANKQHKIRFQDIDAPEKSQAFGNVSRLYLSSLVAGKNVCVKYKNCDRYGRILGTVYVNGKDSDLEMLKTGLAWHYKRYDSTPAYAQAEAEARAVRRGLWADPNPIPPEQFKHPNRVSSSENVGGVSNGNNTRPIGVEGE